MKERGLRVPILVGCVAVAALLLGLGLQGMLRDLARRDWPAAEAVVREYDVGRGLSGNRSRRNPDSYWINARFQYEVEGRKFDGWMRIASGIPTREEAEAQRAKLPPGRRLNLQYDTANPAEHILEYRGIDPSRFLAVGGGLICVGMGAWIALRRAREAA